MNWTGLKLYHDAFRFMLDGKRPSSMELRIDGLRAEVTPKAVTWGNFSVPLSEGSILGAEEEDKDGFAYRVRFKGVEGEHRVEMVQFQRVRPLRKWDFFNWLIENRTPRSRSKGAAMLLREAGGKCFAADHFAIIPPTPFGDEALKCILVHDFITDFLPWNIDSLMSDYDDDGKWGSKAWKGWLAELASGERPDKQCTPGLLKLVNDIGDAVRKEVGNLYNRNQANCDLAVTRMANLARAAFGRPIADELLERFKSAPDDDLKLVPEWSGVRGNDTILWALGAGFIPVKGGRAVLLDFICRGVPSSFLTKPDAAAVEAKLLKGRRRR